MMIELDSSTGDEVRMLNLYKLNSICGSSLRTLITSDRVYVSSYNSGEGDPVAKLVVYTKSNQNINIFDLGASTTFNKELETILFDTDLMLLIR